MLTKMILISKRLLMVDLLVTGQCIRDFEDFYYFFYYFYSVSHGSGVKFSASIGFGAESVA